jgi:GNAT superfamily N-acetyltransferase
MQLRRARADEAGWINDRYATVRFVPSDLERDTVLVAEIDGAPAGLGRLIPLEETSFELGGMLVFDEFRGRGVARALIDELLRYAAGRTVYCLPFAKLEGLYRSAGFETTEEGPAQILAKLEWCRRTYEEPVLLMVTT